MKTAEVAEARIIALIKEAHGPRNATQDGRAIRVKTESPTYQTINGQVVVCHYECHVTDGYELERRVVGDVVVDNEELTLVTILVDSAPNNEE